MEPDVRRSNRSTAVTICLALLFGGGTIFFLDVITFGMFGYVIGAALLFAGVGYVHYLTWGRAMMDEVAGEREEHRLREAMEAPEGSDAVQDLSHRHRYR